MQKMIMVAFATLISLNIWGSTSVKTQPGKLASLLTDHTITSLQVAGEIDARDFKFIADSLDQLTSLDLTEVTISAYSCDDTIVMGGESRFAAASIPCTSFFCKPLVSLKLPLSVKSIGYAAFAGCDQLKEITFPASLDSISSYAFSGSALTTVTIPDNVRTIGQGAFAHCTSLTSANVASENVGNDAFYADTALTSLSLSEGVKHIGESAFKSCTTLSHIAFDGCALTTIGSEAFSGTALPHIDLSAQTSLKEIGDWAFAKSNVATVTLPKSVERLGDGAFFYAAKLEKAHLTNTLTTLPAFTFAGAETLVTDSIIPANTERVEAFSFYNACQMQLIVVPQSIMHIGDKAMAGMTGLKTIKVYTTSSVPELGDSVWAGVDQPSVALDLKHKELAAEFGSAQQWQNFHILKDYILGDVNDDGNLDVADATLLVNYVLGNAPDPFHTELADTNQDGEIDVTDVTTLINMVLDGNEIIISRTPMRP